VSQAEVRGRGFAGSDSSSGSSGIKARAFACAVIFLHRAARATPLNADLMGV
jgi:hypothetical protein